MVGVVVITFIICWFPFALMFTVSPVSNSVAQFFEENELEEWATWLSRKNLLSSLFIKLFYFSVCQLMHEPHNICSHEYGD